MWVKIQKYQKSIHKLSSIVKRKSLNQVELKEFDSMQSLSKHIKKYKIYNFEIVKE